MLIDYHLHNHCSPDSSVETEELVRVMKDQGIRHICLTNHGEWFDDSIGEAGVFEYEEVKKRFLSAKAEIEQIRPRFPGMDIRFGMELQYDPKAMTAMKKITAELPFDFILGSVHLLDGVVISSHVHSREKFAEMDEKTAYTKYFEDMLRWVELGLFDAVAHFDVVKKYGWEMYGPFQPQKYKPLILKILQTMKKKGVGIELNTASLYSRCQELFPHPEILRWCVETGIEHYTLGSDAHELELAGKGIKEALEIAKLAGIRNLSTYEQRKPMKHPLF